MDLRKYKLSRAQIDEAARVLDYQPFLISDDIQTGIAYSWLYSINSRTSPPLIFRRQEWNNEWGKIGAANERLREMYDDFVDEIAKRYPRGSLLDIACNNGYFPVQAHLHGMRDCVGSDIGIRYKQSIEFLNAVCGSRARFIFAPYEPEGGSFGRHKSFDVRAYMKSLVARSTSGIFGLHKRFDVVIMAAILCHIPNPLRFLASVGNLAKEAIFFWGQMLDSNELLIAHNPPYPGLSARQPFPYAFNDNTRISKGLFREAAGQMGFNRVTFLEPKPHWLFTSTPAKDLDAEIRIGSAHVAVLASRD